MPTPEPQAQILPATGLHYGIPFADYKSWAATNFSTLKAIARSPAHCKYEMDNPKEATKGMILGQALHTAVFEPARFRAEFLSIGECDRRTTVGKTKWCELSAANPDVELLRPQDMEPLEGMAKALHAERGSEYYLSGEGQNEVAALWKDNTTGQTCKAKFDRIKKATTGTITLVELKSCRDARMFAFGKECGQRGYDVQHVSYLDAYRTISGLTIIGVMLAVENKPPHALKLYTLSNTALQAGRVKYANWLNLFDKCQAAGRWPGYPGGVEVLELPGYDTDVELEEVTI